MFCVDLFSLSFGQQSRNLKQNYGTVSDEIETQKVRETSAAKLKVRLLVNTSCAFPNKVEMHN